MTRVLHRVSNLFLLSVAALSGTIIGLTSGATQAAEGEWITLIDGTEGMENFNAVGDANWTAEMA